MARLSSSSDVVIVGAGPTGLALAIGLRSAGVDSVVIDRAARRSRESRASVVHCRGLELLDTLGVVEPLIAEGVPITSAAYYDMGLRLGEVRFDDLASAYPYALGIGQDQVEGAMLDRLSELGGRVHRSTSLESIDDRGDRVVIEVTTPGGSARRIEARHLVGCDGASSTVRGIIGADPEGPQRVTPYVIANVEIRGGLDPDAMHLFSAPDGFMVLSALSAVESRLTATLPDQSTPPTREELQVVLGTYGPRADSLTLGEPSYLSRFHLNPGVATTLRAGRVLLAGDAAHTLEPAGGQGMNTGLHDAGNLAWKLAAVCRGEAPLRLLETYETEREDAARDAFARTERLTDALTMNNPIARGVRDGVAVLAERVPLLRRPFQRGIAGLDSVYEAGEYTAGAVSAGPPIRGWGRPGARMVAVPPKLLADGRHHVFVIDGPDGGARSCLPDLAKRVSGYADPPVLHLAGSKGRRRQEVEPWVDERPDVRSVPPRPAVMLVRPDGHVGWTGGVEDLVGLSSHLDRWMARGL